MMQHQNIFFGDFCHCRDFPGVLSAEDSDHFFKIVPVGEDVLIRKNHIFPFIFIPVRFGEPVEIRIDQVL